MSSHIDTTLVQQALPKALGRHMPSAGLGHHADHDSLYANQASRNMLPDQGFICRISGQA